MSITLIVLVIILIIIFIYISFKKESFIVDDKRNLVLYHVPWCGHCVKFMPNWLSLKQSIANSPALAKMVNVTEINCDENTSICDKKNIHSYPTITYEHNGKIIKYSGNREIPDILTFLQNNYLN